jgi:hypothetical protein
MVIVMGEQPIDVRLAEVARTLQSQNTPTETLDRIIEIAAEWLNGSTIGAGITVVHRRTEVETVAATSGSVRRGDGLQY